MNTAATRTPPEKNVGRVVGVLLLLHLAAGLMVPFMMLHSLVSPPGFLASAAAIPNQVRGAVFLLFLGSALAVGVASAAWSVFRAYSSAMALWLLALAIASFTLQAVDNAHLLSMLSLRRQYAEAGAAKRELFQSLALVVGAARKWSHYFFFVGDRQLDFPALQSAVSLQVGSALVGCFRFAGSSRPDCRRHVAGDSPRNAPRARICCVRGVADREGI